MTLRSGLTLFCYTLPTTQSGQVPAVVPYADELHELTFTTVMPGGFGSLTAKIRLSAIDARLPQPQLALFAHCALMDGPTCIFRGEILESAFVVDAADGDSVQLTALGIGNQLRDDPYDVTYNAQTAQQIAVHELVRHGSTFALLPQISQDASQIFPDNPATTYSPAYDGRNMEEIIADIAILAGMYDWAVWEHPSARDGAGFPLGQISVLLHDANTTHYQATLADRDITQAQISASGERAYNYIEMWFNSQNVNAAPAAATAKDPRLTPSTLAQNIAPFRMRKYRRDLSGVSTINSTQAQSIANAFLTQMENITNKISMQLESVRDAQGNALELWRVRAGKNLFVPDLAVRGTTLPTVATPTVNQFAIVSTSYQENATSAVLALELDNYKDYAERQIARLQLAADQQSRGKKFASLLQMLGAPVKGACGYRFLATAAGQSGGGTVTYPTQLYQIPTSVTISADITTNATGIAPTNLSVYRFILNFQSVAAGDCQVSGHYTTAGNTIRAIDGRRGRFDWHCSGCDTLHSGLSLRRDLLVVKTHPSGAHVPGWTGLTVRCPACGMIEGFNTALTSEDETHGGGGAHRAAHARLIRRLMAHRAVGLAVLP